MCCIEERRFGIVSSPCRLLTALFCDPLLGLWRQRQRRLRVLVQVRIVPSAKARSLAGRPSPVRCVKP